MEDTILELLKIQDGIKRDFDNKLLLTPQEAMSILGIGRNRMYESLLKDNTFPSMKIGNRYYINRDKLQSWIDKQCS